MEFSKDRAAVDAVAQLLREAAEQAGKLAIACQACGDCCRFDDYDHRMFVTTLELAYILARVDALPAPQVISTSQCPFQNNGRCAIHDDRMLGCRIFFCRHEGLSDGSDWAETLHRKLVGLHETYCAPYSYIEWCDSLRRLATCLAPPEGPNGSDETADFP